MLATIKEAIVESCSKWQAADQVKENREAFEKTGDRNYRELAVAYRQLERGKKLISLNKAFQLAGTHPDGSPVIAIANAASRWCWYEFHGGWDSSFNTPMANFVSDFRRNPSSRPNGNNKATWGTKFKINRDFFPIAPKQNLRAIVPIVPAKHLPRGHLSNYQILWEANWVSAPVDPLLLRRVTTDFFAVVAQWDLTPVERMVLESSVFATE